MLPIADDVGGRSNAIACITLGALCLIGFFAQMGVGDDWLISLGFMPGRLFGGVQLPDYVPVIPPPATLITYMFLHVGWLHLLGNLLYLWVFGPRVEAAMGPGPFTVFFISAGVAAALGEAWALPGSAASVVGASGGVSGILGAYLVLFPRAEVRVVVPVVVTLRIISLPAYLVLAVWFLLQLLLDWLTPAGTPGIAFRAHLLGFVAGAVLAPFFAPAWLRARFA